MLISADDCVKNPHIRWHLLSLFSLFFLLLYFSVYRLFLCHQKCSSQLPPLITIFICFSFLFFSFFFSKGQHPRCPNQRAVSQIHVYLFFPHVYVLFFFSFILRAWHGSLQCKICTPVPEQIVESGRLIILILISHPCRTRRPTVMQVFLDGNSVRCSLPPSRLSGGVEYPPRNSAGRPWPEIESDFYIWFLATVQFHKTKLT